MTDHQILK
jgi:hypothetical protein